jgi:hypothetical protein
MPSQVEEVLEQKLLLKELSSLETTLYRFIYKLKKPSGGVSTSAHSHVSTWSLFGLPTRTPERIAGREKNCQEQPIRLERYGWIFRTNETLM